MRWFVIFLLLLWVAEPMVTAQTPSRYGIRSQRPSQSERVMLKKEKDERASDYVTLLDVHEWQGYNDWATKDQANCAKESLLSAYVNGVSATKAAYWAALCYGDDDDTTTSK